MLLGLAVLAASASRFEVDITALGGVGDGKTSNTRVFVEAVALIASHGGGRLMVPGARTAGGGSRFVTGPFNLTSHMVLEVAAGATLVGSINMSEWPLMPPMPSYGQGRDHPGPRRVSLIHGFNLTNVTVTGAGTVDGSGQWWWARHRAKLERYTRGHLIEFMWSTELEVSYLTLINSPFWTVHPVYCQRFHGHHLTILNDHHSPNTDGIDPDSTVDVVLSHNYISTGDDCYALKSGWDKFGYDYGLATRNVTISDGFCSSPTSAAICIGSEMSGGVADVTVRNMTIVNTGFAFRLKTGAGRGGYIRNLSFADSTIKNCSVGFEFSEFYGGHPEGGFDPTALPIVDGVRTKNVAGTADSVAVLKGLQVAEASSHAMRGVVFENVSVSGGAWSCANVWGGSAGTPGACPCLATGCP